MSRTLFLTLLLTSLSPDGLTAEAPKDRSAPRTEGQTRVAVAPVRPAMSRAEIEAGLKSHDRALYIKQGWIRDPYIKLGPDDNYYLTGTTPNPDDPREQSDPYNIGLGPESIVGTAVQVWRSRDLVAWE